jgi:HEAT repeat protein
MKDKRFVIKAIINNVSDNNAAREFFKIGSFFCKRKEKVAKEIGAVLIWRGYVFNPEKVKEFLLSVANDDNWEVREYAAGAFSNILYHNKDFYKTVIKWAKHPSENIRRAVVFAAVAFQEKKDLPKAFSILEPLMFDNSKYVRKILGHFILGSYFGSKFPKETVSQLKKWSKIHDENVRWNIIMAFRNRFGNMYPNETLEVLKLFTGDVDLVVKKALMSTLAFLNKRHSLLVEKFMRDYGFDVVREID